MKREGSREAVDQPDKRTLHDYHGEDCEGILDGRRHIGEPFPVDHETGDATQKSYGNQNHHTADDHLLASAVMFKGILRLNIIH